MDLFGGDYIVYGYDETYQLINESRTGSASYQLSWTYDEVGNRLTQNKNGVITSYTNNDANQLVSELTNGLATVYEYDANGNQVEMVENFGHPKARVYNWGYDWENRQVLYNAPGKEDDATYTYTRRGQATYFVMLDLLDL